MTRASARTSAFLSRTTLTIAGLDPGGGAGAVADLRGFAAAGSFGCAVLAVLTVQSTSGLVLSEPVDARLVARQLAELGRVQRIDAVKTGALGSAGNVVAVARWLACRPRLPVVVDPVMLPSSGTASLLSEGALRAMRRHLVPRATLVTPNAPEAEALTGRPVRSVSDARVAARRIVAMGARAALVKGGHLDEPMAVDVLAIGEHAYELSALRLAIPPVHGGGCVLASLIAGRMAVRGRGTLEARLLEAVRWARRVHRRALKNAMDVGGARRVLVP